MKKILLILPALLLAGAAWFALRSPDVPQDPEEAGFVSLYNGSDLTGWRKIGGGSTFEAVGDDIVGRHGPGENTFLRTEQTYSDFTLRMQMRWDEPGNSGVLFRAAQRDGNGRAFGYQYELDDGERAWTAGIYDEARRGWLANMAENEQARAAVRLNDWNDIEIQAVGPHLKTWINGVPAADIVDAFDSEGFIALQVHSGDRGIMRWRNIRIREEAPVTQAGADLAELRFWQTEGIDELSVAGRRVSGNTNVDGASLLARRQFGDALVRFDLPVCDAPARVRFMQLFESPGVGDFAELTLTRDRAQISVRVNGKEQVGEPQRLAIPADVADVRLVNTGGALVVSVGEQDIARLTDTGLPSRGQWQLYPAPCGENWLVDNFHWTDLAANAPEVAFYKNLDTKPAPVLEPAQAQQAFRIAPEFEIELVAAEPLVEDPVAMSWDEYGRLYVVELRGYMPDAYGTGRDEPVGQVVRLEDTDGDGQMDTSEVFLGTLVNPRAVAVINEGVLVGEPPHLWLCHLPTKDAVCEDKESLGIYGEGVGTASVEHLENRLLPGLDNWIYNAKSSRQLRLVDGELQVRQGLFRGQWGMDKDSVGRLYYNNNSNWVQGDLFAAEDLLQGKSTVPPRGLGEVFNESESVYTVRVNPGVNRAYLEGTLREDGRLNNTTGASGLAVYRGDQFPPAFRDHAFVPESAGNVVGQFALVEQGMELVAEHQLYEDDQWGQREFLGSTDERFRPVDARVGPDGALYIIDMYRGIIQDQHFLTDELREQIFQRELDAPIGRGRIWRV
ncbi:MAG: PVC-type heme-binding CxxCH protein, partial [Pseudomonadota bacterium]